MERFGDSQGCSLKCGALTGWSGRVRLPIMSSKRTCASCAQTFNVPAASNQLVACPWCGAAVPAPSPAVTARPPAAPPAAVTANGRAAPPARREEPASSSWPASIIIVVIGGFGLLSVGVLAIVVLGALLFFR